MSDKKKKKQRAMGAAIGVGAAVVTALVVVLAIVLGVSQTGDRPSTPYGPSTVIEAGAETSAETH